MIAIFIFRYDFDGDGIITADDVYIILSYIPFKTHDKAG